MLVNSIFFFSHNVFNPIRNKKIIILVDFIFSSTDALNLDQCRILLFDKVLNVLLSFIWSISVLFKDSFACRYM